MVDVNNITESLVSDSICGTIDFEGLRRKVEDEMTKQEVERKYGKNIQQMPNGLWWIRLENGKVIKLTKRENVIHKLCKLEQYNKEQTLQSFWSQFLSHRRLSNADGTVRIDIRYYGKFIVPSKLAQIPLSKITITDIEKWSEECLQIKPNMKEKYFDGVRGTLSQMFQYAMACKLITQNPVANLIVHQDKFAPKNPHKDEDDFFLPHEEKAVIELAYTDADDTHEAISLAIPLLFLVGIRDGELCGLHWRDVEGDYLHVQEELIEKIDDEGRFDGYKLVPHCKTSAGNRFVRLNTEAKAILEKVRMLNITNDLPVGLDDYIFLRRHKGQITFCTTRCFESRIKKYCRKANMKVLKSQHDVRRTFATTLYYAGMPKLDISKAMGHESLTQTEGYIKARPNSNILDYMEALSNRNKSEQNIDAFLEDKKIGNA